MDELEKFIEAIKIELGSRLIEQGFNLMTTSMQAEYVRLDYAKAVEFGNGWRKFNISFTPKPSGIRKEFFIYIEVSSEQTAMFLGTMRALQANFLSLDALDQMRWTYLNFEEFSQRLKEIQALMEEKLFDWFEDPDLAPYKRNT